MHWQKAIFVSSSRHGECWQREHTEKVQNRKICSDPQRSKRKDYLKVTYAEKNAMSKMSVWYTWPHWWSSVTNNYSSTCFSKVKHLLILCHRAQVYTSPSPASPTVRPRPNGSSADKRWVRPTSDTLMTVKENTWTCQVNNNLKSLPGIKELVTWCMRKFSWWLTFGVSMLDTSLTHSCVNLESRTHFPCLHSRM